MKLGASLQRTKSNHKGVNVGTLVLSLSLMQLRSSQHRQLNTPPQNGCREMSRFVHKAVNVILKLVIFFIVEHKEFHECCNFLIPIILTNARVLLGRGFIVLACSIVPSAPCSTFARTVADIWATQLAQSPPPKPRSCGSGKT